jgi:hypothetical protein
VLLDWVRKGGKVVSGGKLQTELGKTALRPLLAQWSASGRLILLPNVEIAVEQAAIEKAGIHSNDSHVLAITRLSNSRVVVTRDQLLMRDLKDRSVMGERRKIYPMPERAIADTRINRGVLRNAECN